MRKLLSALDMEANYLRFSDLIEASRLRLAPLPLIEFVLSCGVSPDRVRQRRFVSSGDLQQQGFGTHNRAPPEME